jgi:hypothetical protein
MRNKLPVYLENMELPKDTYGINTRDNNNSYGYVSIMYLASIIITVASVLTVIFVGK